MTVSFHVRGDYKLAYVRTPAAVPPPEDAGPALGVLFCSGLVTPMSG
jgi:hypothetical protein